MTCAPLSAAVVLAAALYAAAVVVPVPSVTPHSALHTALAGGTAAPLAHLQARPAGVLLDGKPFQWRGISAFRLVEMEAHGRHANVSRYLDWAAARHLTVVRVFTMARHL